MNGWLNLYAYVENSPLVSTDPFGQMGWSLTNPDRWGNPRAPTFDPGLKGPDENDLKVLAVMATLPVAVGAYQFIAASVALRYVIATSVRICLAADVHARGFRGD